MCLLAAFLFFVQSIPMPNQKNRSVSLGRWSVCTLHLKEFFQFDAVMRVRVYLPTKPRLGAIFASNHSLELRIGSDRVFLLILKYDGVLGLLFRKIKNREFSTHFDRKFPKGFRRARSQKTLFLAPRRQIVGHANPCGNQQNRFFSSN